MEHGQLIGRKYVLKKRLGKGGMGIVYLAYDVKLHKYWAMKQLRIPDEEHESDRQSVRSEIMAVKKLDHKNLPRIVDVIEEKGLCYLVMDYVRGITLQEKIIQQNGIGEKELIHILDQITDALRYLHTQKENFIFCDLKPANIMITEDGVVKIIDFGASRSRNGPGGPVRGTRGFAAPEQYEGIADERSDIYALGKTMLACRRNKYYSLMLRRILRICTMDKPKKRFQNIEEVKKALRIRRVIRWVLITMVIMINMTLVSFFCGSAVLTGSYNKALKEYDHMAMMGEFEEASIGYRKLIMETGTDRMEAYWRLLELYQRQNKEEEGILCVGDYLKQNQPKEMAPLASQIAQFYFYEKGMYQEAAKWFQMVIESLDGKYQSKENSFVHTTYEETEYYLKICECLTEVGIADRVLSEALEEFTKYNHSLADIPHKIQNSQNIAKIYITCEDRITDGLIKAAAVLKKEEEMIACYEGEKLEEYRQENLTMLSSIYKMLGRKNPKSKQLYYEKAMDYISQLFGSSGGIDENLYKMKTLDMAQMYEELGKRDQALWCLENRERNYPEGEKEVLYYHLCLLIREKGNEATVRQLVEILKKQEGIEEDSQYLKMMAQIDRYLQE